MNKELCAYFEGEFSHGPDWLAHTIADRLHLRFGASQIVSGWLVPRWVIEVETRGAPYCLFLMLRQGDKWWVHFLPPSKSHCVAQGDHRDNDVSRLQTIAQEVHAVLSEMPEVAGLRWYFRGSKSSVSTPEELLGA